MLAALFIIAAWPAQAQDARVCYADLTLIPRTADGAIKRSTAARAAFVRTWPCPATGEVTGSCAGWQIDHTIPLANGGCDRQVNMQWLPVSIKTCRDLSCKDRWERWVYAPAR